VDARLGLVLGEKEMPCLYQEPNLGCTARSKDATCTVLVHCCNAKEGNDKDLL